MSPTVRTAIGVVEGGAWIGGGPPHHPTWRVIRALDAQHDLVPVDLDRTIARNVGVLIVPQLTSLTQPQLDRLRDAIDQGRSTIVVADPMPVLDLRLLPGQPIFDEDGLLVERGDPPSPPKGNAEAFLAHYGVAWDSGQLLIDTEATGDAPNEVVMAEAAAPLVGPVVAVFAGAIEAIARDDVAFEPRVTTRRPVLVGSIDDAVTLHPLFGPQFSSRRTPPTDESPRVRTIVAKVAPPTGSPRGTLLVVTDLDMLGEPWADSAEGSALAIENAKLLEGLLGELGVRSAAVVRPELGAALLDPALREHVSEIDLVAQEVFSRPPEESDAGEPTPSAEMHRRPVWVRLRRTADQWSLRSTFEQPADGTRIGALLDALTAARWEAASIRVATPKDPTTVDPSESMRVVVRDADGATLVDVLIDGPHGERIARATFDREGPAARLAIALQPSVADFVEPVDLDTAPADIASSTFTTYVVDVALGKLTSVESGVASAPSIAALLAAEIRPARRYQVARLHDLLQFGFYVTPEGKLYGSVGDITLTRRDGTTLHVVFGGPHGQARAVMIEGRQAADDRSVWVFVVDEPTAQKILGGAL